MVKRDVSQDGGPDGMRRAGVTPAARRDPLRLRAVRTRIAMVGSPGDVALESRELPEPGAGEAIVRVAECGLCGSDLKLYSGQHPKLQPPLVLGHEFHGTVATGERAGERVAVFPPVGCGH